MINYDVPVEKDHRTPAYETYLHRIGRSGRFGRKGAAFNLVTGEQASSNPSQVKETTCKRWLCTVGVLHFVLTAVFYLSQEKNVLNLISEYFKHEIPEVPYNDEDAFVNVLKEAGLTDG